MKARTYELTVIAHDAPKHWDNRSNPDTVNMTSDGLLCATRDGHTLVIIAYDELKRALAAAVRAGGGK